ncbi:MAG: hypothetical protein JST92_11845 [Deltaproteobacteria bacterium]|nr:hypothetical protein [Deltaproteobacteria bacterium]
MASTPAPNVQQLLQTAADDGALSPQTFTALSIPDLGAQIQAGLGVCPDDVPSSEVLLVTMMPDDSGSMAPSAQLVRDGHNGVLDALLASKQRDSILAHTRYLNGRVLFPYRGLDQALRLDARNYTPDQGTPLYDQTMIVLGTVLAKAQEFQSAGVQVRTVTLLLTDGADLHSTRFKARDVAALVNDLRRLENHVVAAMGLYDGGTDFRAVFRDMGIEDRWILTPGATAKEVRQAFAVFSQSAVRLSQGAAGFARASVGGFGAP